MSKRILQVLPAMHSGGVERGTIEISEAIIRKGWESHVISAGGQLVNELTEGGTKHYTLNVQSKNPYIIWKNGEKLANYIKKHNIDLIHARSRAPAWSCVRASRICNTPLITTFHGQYGHASGLKRWYNSSMLRGIKVIAVSDFIKNHIKSTYGIADHKIKTIYRGIDPETFNPETISEQRTQSILDAWDISIKGQTVVMLAGRLTRLKGHKTLVEALKKVERQTPHQRLLTLIVGPTAGREAYIQEIQQHIDSLELRDEVKFVGSCSDMPAAYALADIIVSSSTKPESFGRTTCEAQAMGKRVVASDHGGTKETLCPEQKQGLFSPNDADSMAQALINQCGQSEERIQAIAKISGQHIIDHYQLDKMKALTVSLYKSILLEN